MRALEARGQSVRVAGLRQEFNALLAIVTEAGAGAAGAPAAARAGALERTGRAAWDAARNAVGMVAFLGEGAVYLGRAVLRPRRIRWRSVFYNLQAGGVAAMPITGLLSFLMGIVIAYQGAAQLQQYGASIFVADLVGLSMLRELSPLLTAIIIAGRSGSAYAAEIGTMKVTEEIDALRTVGIPPMDLLVLPKALALLVALPLLTVYTDVMGVVGGMIMAHARLGIGTEAFLDRLEYAIDLSSFLIGVGKAPVFAVIIALVGCYQGFQAGGGADSVGRQTTASVVQSIFIVIIVDAMFSIAFSALGI
jgi:phospholipid/cholesterol/gamma-HCH transport system permease protein